MANNGKDGNGLRFLGKLENTGPAFSSLSLLFLQNKIKIKNKYNLVLQILFLKLIYHKGNTFEVNIIYKISNRTYITTIYAKFIR